MFIESVLQWFFVFLICFIENKIVFFLDDESVEKKEEEKEEEEDKGEGTLTWGIIF